MSQRKLLKIAKFSDEWVGSQRLFQRRPLNLSAQSLCVKTHLESFFVLAVPCALETPSVSVSLQSPITANEIMRVHFALDGTMHCSSLLHVAKR